MDGAEHVVVGEQVVEAERFDGETDLADGHGIAAQLDLRVHDTDLHRGHPATQHPRRSAGMLVGCCSPTSPTSTTLVDPTIPRRSTTRPVSGRGHDAVPPSATGA